MVALSSRTHISRVISLNFGLRVRVRVRDRVGLVLWFRYVKVRRGRVAGYLYWV